MIKSDLIMAVNQICAEKDLPLDVILGAIEEALVHAYRRNFANNNACVQVRIDAETGDLSLSCEKTIVETVEDESVEISLADAHEIDQDAEIGGVVLVEREPANFGRIAAQTAKQVILQRIHEAEREALYDSFRQREGELITGGVQSIDYRTDQVTISLGKKAEGILAREDQIPKERYRIGQSVRALLSEVTKGTRGPQIRLSRTHRGMLRRLLEREVPEIYSGAVEIKSIAREPGQRSKVAVVATQPGVDPVGSCVGMRGTRIQNIVDELNGEKIDVVEWDSEVRQFIRNALSPAKPTDTVLIEEGDVRTAIVVVPDRSLSLAIGKEGQNARLAAKLTGWRIDIKSETEAATEGLAEIKRQQMQMIKTRSLEARANASEMPADDLLGRAEWLLRERDKAAVTLEDAAKLLSRAQDAAPTEEIDSLDDVPAIAAAEITSMAGDGSPADLMSDEAVPADAGIESEGAVGVGEDAELEVVAEFNEQANFDLSVEAFGGEPYPDLGTETLEDEDEDDAKRQKRKQASKKRELVFDEKLGEVVARRKRKPSRGSWEDYDEYDE